jgi:hypothetical protein
MSPASRLHMHAGSFTATDGIETKLDPWFRMLTARMAPLASVCVMTATKLDPPPPTATIVVPKEQPLVVLASPKILRDAMEPA